MKDERCVVCLDIGGTSVKSGVVKIEGALCAGSYREDPVDSAGTADEILAAFSASLQRALDFVQQNDTVLEGIGVAIPGPFDYQQGISKIKDMDKYEALYDLNVKEGLRQRLRLPRDLPLLFENDAWSFARGEVWVGAGIMHSRVIVFTMGTGVGSAFAVDQKIVDEGPGVPWSGWIAGQEYKDSILNNYISRTFMIRRYKELSGRLLDVDDIASTAREGDTDAQRVFEEIGAELGHFVREHHAVQFGVECFIFGGQISKSLDLFIGPFASFMEDVPSLRAILPAADIECSALKGAAKFVFDSVSQE